MRSASTSSRVGIVEADGSDRVPVEGVGFVAHAGEDVVLPEVVGTCTYFKRKWLILVLAHHLYYLYAGRLSMQKGGLLWYLLGSDYGGGILVLGEQGARFSLHSTHSITTRSIAGDSSSRLYFPLVGGCCSKNIRDLIKTKVMMTANNLDGALRGTASRRETTAVARRGTR